MRTPIRFLLLALLTAGIASAQIPGQTIVQAVPAATPATAPSMPAGNAAAANAGLTALQELKAANEEILKRQAATLQQLDEIQKAAEQLKIYSKRG